MLVKGCRLEPATGSADQALTGSAARGIAKKGTIQGTKEPLGVTGVNGNQRRNLHSQESIPNRACGARSPIGCQHRLRL